MELKVVCHCGQKYKFDVEPVNRQMPFAVNCPVCNLDGTQLANGLLAQTPMPIPASPPPIPVAASPTLAAPAPPRPVPSALKPAMAGPAPRQPKYMQDNPALQNNNFMLGILGAILGAIVAVGLMVGFTMFTGMRFPLMGTVMGAIIGGGARLMYRGTSSTLGAMSAVVALVTIAGTLFLMFGILGTLLSGFVSLVIGCGLAFKIASD